MPTDDRLRPHPKDRLAASVQRISFVDAAAKLRAEPHAAVSGHRQVTLVKHGPVTVILFVFERGGALKEHQTDGEVTIQVLAGRLAVSVGTEQLELGAQEIVALAPGQRHAVRAIEGSEMLLTVFRTPTERTAAV